MAEIVSEVTSRPSGGAGNGARSVISNTVQAGSLTKLAERPAADRGEERSSSGGDGGTIENIVHAGGERAVPDRVRKMLENLDKHGTVKPTAEQLAAAPAPAEAPAATAPAETPAAPAAAAPVAAPAAPPASTATQPPPEIERVTARNRELVEENTRLKQGGARRELSPREKTLDEIERGYLDDSRGAVRRLIALALGHDDPKHADVSAEYKGLLQELTAEDLGVTVDPSQQAIREAARTRHILARDKREQTASTSKPAEPSDGPDVEYHRTISSRLQERQTDGKTIADANPVLKLLGAKPEAALLQVIQHGLNTGEMDPKSDNNTLIQQAIAKVHKHFETQHQVLAGIYGGATAPSTAQPTAATETANKDAGQGQAPRSITNASASVAPATSPAKSEPTTQQPKRYRTEEARRQAIIDRLAK